MQKIASFFYVAIESNDGTLEDSDEWELSEDSDGLDNGDEESDDSDCESDEDSSDIVEENANRFKIHNASNLPDWERIETSEDNIAIEQEAKIVAAYADKHAEDIDPYGFY